MWRKKIDSREEENQIPVKKINDFCKKEKKRFVWRKKKFLNFIEVVTNLNISFLKNITMVMQLHHYESDSMDKVTLRKWKL